MTKHKSKVDLLCDIQTERARLEKALKLLTPADMTGPGIVGEWTIKDVIAHLTAWEQLFLAWYEAGKARRAIETKPVGMSRKAIDALNEQIFKRNRRRSLSRVLAEFRDSYQAVLTAVQGMTEDELFGKGCYQWTGKLTVADYVEGNTSNHYRWAAFHIRQHVRRQDEPSAK